MIEQTQNSVSLSVSPFIDTYSDCYVRTVAAILNYYDCPNPALCFGQSYAFIQVFRTNTVPTLCAGMFPVGVSLRHLGIARANCATSDITEAWQRICTALQAKRPILARVDVYHIPYLPYYHKQHNLHNIIISGFDDNDGTVNIVDNVANHCDSMTRSDLFQALPLPHELAISLGSKDKIHWQEFAPAPEGFQFDPRLSTLAHYLRMSISLWDQTQVVPEQLMKYIPHFCPGEISDLKRGWQSIEEYAFGVPEMVQALPPRSSVWEPPFNEYRLLSQQAMWFARYVRNLQELIQSTDEFLVQSLEKIAQRWMIIQSVMVKYTIKPKNDVPQRLKEMCVELAEQHKQLLKPLQQLVNRAEAYELN